MQSMKAEHNEAVNFLDVITGRNEITVDYEPGSTEIVRQHDGSLLKLRKLANDYDATDRVAAMNFLETRKARGEIVTGLLYVDPEADDMHGYLGTPARPLNAMEDGELCPGSSALERLNASLR